MRKIYHFAFLLCFIAIIALPTKAHPGKTDGSGGHTDHSTGEYHYHHGYGAHEHYDMDGDGDVDCPYDFDDQTDHSRSSVNSSRDYHYDLQTSEPIPSFPQISATEPVKAAISNTGEVKDVPSWIYYTIGTLVVLIATITLISIFNSKALRGQIFDTEEKYKHYLSSQERQYKKELEDQKYGLIEEKNREVNKIRSKLILAEKRIDLLSLKNEQLQKDRHAVVCHPDFNIPVFPSQPVATEGLFRIDIPDNVYFNTDYMPVEGEISKNKPYGNFTAYITSSGKKYHMESSCVGFSEIVHLYDVIESKAPCSKCAWKKISLTEAPDWYKKTKKIASELINFELATGIRGLSSSPYEDLNFQNIDPVFFTYELSEDDIRSPNIGFIAIDMDITYDDAKRFVNQHRAVRGYPLIK